MFICIYEEYAGVGQTLKDAFNSLQNNYSEAEVDDCVFFEGTDIAVEIKIVKVDTVKSIKKA